MDKVFELGSTVSYSRGDIVKIDDEVVNYIESGYVGVYSNVDGVRRLLFVFVHGDIFPYRGTPDIFTGHEYTYIALSKLSIRFVDHEMFNELMKDPGYSLTVLANMQRIIYLQFERIDNLQKGQILERLLERLSYIAKRAGVQEGDKVVFDVLMSHVDLASSIGASRETVNRYMKQLEAEGILVVRKQRITILSPAKLEEALRQKQLPLKRSWAHVPLVALQTGLALQGALVVIGELT
jgi:CRP/FNR family cyclic AMP-dependent transcriptional regulator